MEKEKPLFYYEDEKGAQEGSKELFAFLTKASFIDKMVVKELKPIKQNTSDVALQKYLIPLYESFKKNPPSLLVKKKTEGHYTIHAYEKIKKGQVVAEYLGEFDPTPKTLSSYRFGPIDAKNYRNLASFVEDGFPNLAAFYLYDVEGVPLRVLYIALEEIQKGEMLLLNYGISHSVKLEHHEEYHFFKMKEFFQKNTLSNLLEKVKIQNPLNFESCLLKEEAVAKLQYLYQTPSALLSLLLERSISAKEVFSIFDEVRNRVYYLGYSFTPHLKEQELFCQMNLIKDYFFLVEKADLRIFALLSRVRVRILVKYFIKNLLENKEPSMEEALYFEKAFDALSKKDEESLILNLLEVKEKELLLEELFSYADLKKEDFYFWLETVLERFAVNSEA